MKKTFKTFALMLLTAFALSSCVDVPAPFNVPDKSSSGDGGTETPVEPAGEGTLESPYNVAAIVAIVSEMEAGVESTQEYYVKGKVLNVTTTAETISQYGNHTFTMVDEGTKSPVFTAFQVYGPGKKKFTSVDDVKAGDEVVVCGKVVNYRGNTPETVGKGASYVVSINSEGGGGGEQGDVQHISIAEFLQKADPNTTYELTGTVSNITNTTFGNFDLVEDGSSISIYGLLDLNGQKQKFASLGIEEGDKVTLTGKYKLYNNKPEIADAQFVSVVKSGGGGETPPVGDVQHITIAEFLAKADVNTTYELTGTVSNITNTTYGNFDLVEDGSSIYIYGLLDLNGQKQKFASLGIEEGDKVTLTGKYKLYNNKPEIADAQFVSVVKGDGGQGGDGGDTPGGDDVTELVNGGFEEWVSDSEPKGWKSASSASSATLSKSTDARNGSFACQIAAPGTQNKRLATQEMTLEAGSYTFSFYAKCTTGNASQVRAGYVPIKEDGSVGVYNYKDAEENDDYIDLNNNGWTLVTYDFKLDASTKLCLVIMNPKNSSYSVSQDILIDDATLVKK